MAGCGRLLWKTVIGTGLALALAACGDAGSGDPVVVPSPDAPADALAVAGATEAVVAEKRPDERYLEAVNAVRATGRRCGSVDYPPAPPVTWNERTERAALAHAEYLQQNNRFAHLGENGSTVGERLTTTGYDWSTVGENLAAGYVELGPMVRDWLASPSHCAVLMNPAFVHMGMVMVPGTSSNTYRSYWGLVLARPRG